LPPSIYDLPETDSVLAQHDRVLDSLAEKLPKVVAHLAENRADVLAFENRGVAGRG
jgi:putative transposase